MAETFTGPLVWITMCRNIDVRHPDGRIIRAYGTSREDDAKAREFGKRALVTVKIPDSTPGGGAFDPYVISIVENPTPSTNGREPCP
ncbi:hypothetical protein AKG11_03450 [Shinella sp. SUS2]|uniref:hypothetical protein n=1 Tax=unclassified Shinella TaxID=2643062 RepID=UPI000680BA08|nr:MULTISPECIES: hypothetical protein [unclassified Shinella]KNY18209.1 hypothetical protein AKG11_03450 [Shinella sp. SUS2]KOC77404.1 hypothetical protein AKG10_00920 [Shinella sp. GWS1]